MDLNHARLPIPPRWQVNLNRGNEKIDRVRKPADLFYRDQADCQTLTTSHDDPIKQAVTGSRKCRAQDRKTDLSG
jgi:hypothetical protein